MKQYPHGHSDLVEYLKQHPVIRVCLPTYEMQYTFKSCDGIRFTFLSHNNGNLVTFGCQGSLIGGKIEYNEDGFTRILSTVVVWYYYTGPKPWKDKNPQWVEWKQKMDDWNLVLEGIKEFAD